MFVCISSMYVKPSHTVNWHLIIPDCMDKVKHVYLSCFVGDVVVILGSLYSHSLLYPRVVHLRYCLLPQTSLPTQPSDGVPSCRVRLNCNQ